MCVRVAVQFFFCQNSCAAGVFRHCFAKAFEYPWLGCSGITEGDALPDDFGNLTDLRGNVILRFVTEQCGMEHLEDNGIKRLTDREAEERLRMACGCSNVQDIGGWTAEKRDAALRKALGIGVSIRQLSRLTGIGKAIIERTARRQQDKKTVPAS
jgi:hypothetical protein